MDGRHFTWSFPAGEDLDNLNWGTGDLFRAVALDDGKIAANGLEAGGILLYGGKKDEHVTLGYLGVMKFYASEHVQKGARLTVAENGSFRESRPGDYAVGRCLDTAVSAGSIGTGAFNFTTPMQV